MSIQERSVAEGIDGKYNRAGRVAWLALCLRKEDRLLIHIKTEFSRGLDAS